MKQKNQIIMLVALVVVAAGVWGWESWTPAAGKSAGSAGFLQKYQPMAIANPEIRFWEVDRRRKAEYKPSGINLFSTEGPKPPVVPVKVLKPGEIGYVPPAPPLPPPPPELPGNMKFFGYGTVPIGTPRRAFLEDGDDVYIVSEGDVLMGRFRILKINNASLEFEEISSGRRGQRILEDQGPAA